ncbi:MAG TPA: MFS transporter [Acidobacteriaceae bacterium]|nr:MFS transporter [Acidobacteriaceae bacterium]
MTSLTTDPPGKPAKSSGFEPLGIPTFRDLWLASIVSNLGSWMQDTAGAWLMTVLTTSPLLVALMQTAASLPVVLLGLLAGATADIYDRRRLLLFWQTWMLLAVAILSVLTFFDIISPWILLILTFLLNIGAAMNSPAWQAIVPEVVPRAQLPDAISLNSAGFNLARAVGPAMGGLAIALFIHATTGAASVFSFNSLSFLAVILVLYRWQRNPLFKSALPSERIRGSMRSGVRYLRYAPMLQAAFMRTLIFTLFVSAVWALLPLVARNDLRQGALGYGILNGSMGFGAVIGATLLPRVRRILAADAIIGTATGVFVATLLILTFVKVPLIVIAFLVAGGFAWTSAMSTLNLAVQVSVPAWVQARALGAYQMVFSGGMALGGVIWGYIAEHVSVSKSLLCAAIGLGITLPWSLRFSVLKGTPPDLTPHLYRFPAPTIGSEREDTDGPVRVSIDYHIDPSDYAEFTQAIHRLRDVRLRDGAIRWGVYQDADDPRHMNETFITESWLEYLRQRERFTASDLEIRDRVWQLHRGKEPPRISHMFYAKEASAAEPKSEPQLTE